MAKTDWTRSVHSDTLAPYLLPEIPSLDDEVEIRVRIGRQAPVVDVFVRAIVDGVDLHVVAIPERSDRRFRWYCARLRLRQSATHYHFLLRTRDEGTLYYGRRGVTTVYPNEDYDFTITTDSRAPAWVGGSVFYQIFPDRFCRGNPLLGVRDGEISRGAFASREMAWSDEPLDYPEGGSLDFFNGDLPGIEQKLDYLVDLGVNALYLTPIFTAKTNHRYDCLDYFSVDSHLGGDEALASLVAAAHQRSVRVVLDVSINHIGVEHPWADGLPHDGEPVRVVLLDDGRPVHWAGVADLLKLDYSVAALRDVMYRGRDSVVRRYLRAPFQIDGWRFDVASETGRYGRMQEQCHDVWREVRSVVREDNSEAYVIGEHWHDSLAYLQGDQWDSAMNYFASGRVLRMWMGEQDRFAVHPSQEAAPGRRISGIELTQLLEQHFARIPSGVVHAQFNLLDSHDVTRLHTNGAVFEWRIYEGVVMLLSMLPGTFCVYYGDEVGLSGSLHGDHGKRHPMCWDRSLWDSRFVTLYRRMIGLKRSRECLRRGSCRVLDAGDDYVVYARFTVTEALVLVLNRRREKSRLTIDLSPLGVDRCEVLVGPDSVTLTAEVATVELEANTSTLIGCVSQPGQPDVTAATLERVTSEQVNSTRSSTTSS